MKLSGKPVPNSIKRAIRVAARLVRGGAGSASAPGHRKRKRGLQGRPLGMPRVRELLWEWFVDIRMVVKGRLPLRCLMAQARVFRQQWLQEEAAQGRPWSRAPQVRSRWMKRWRDDYGVSLRVPSARFKVHAAGGRGPLRQA